MALVLGSIGAFFLFISSQAASQTSKEQDIDLMASVDGRKKIDMLQFIKKQYESYEVAQSNRQKQQDFVSAIKASTETATTEMIVLGGGWLGICQRC